MRSCGFMHSINPFRFEIFAFKCKYLGVELLESDYWKIKVKKFVNYVI